MAKKRQKAKLTVTDRRDVLLRSADGGTLRLHRIVGSDEIAVHSPLSPKFTPDDLARALEAASR